MARVEPMAEGDLTSETHCRHCRRRRMKVEFHCTAIARHRIIERPLHHGRSPRDCRTIRIETLGCLYHLYHVHRRAFRTETGIAGLVAAAVGGSVEHRQTGIHIYHHTARAKKIEGGVAAVVAEVGGNAIVA